MRTDYPSHDLAYQRKRAEGGIGWGTEADFAEHRASLAKVLGRVPAGKLLELGCGAGNVALELAAKGFAVEGIDIAPTAIAWARENAARAKVSALFQVGSVLELPYADERFDFVLDGHCLHCIIGDDRLRFLAEARRVLRPGGAFCVHSMCGEPCEGLLAQFDQRTRCLVREGIASRYLGLPGVLAGEVEAAGFRLEHLELERPANGEDQPMLLILAIRD